MRERVYLAGGWLELRSSEHGTALRARLPALGQSGAAVRSVGEQAVT
jgi:signal transduction histidine kinase